MRAVALTTLTVSALLLVACGPEETESVSGPYCELGQTFDYIDNGEMTLTSDRPEYDVARFQEVVIYLESPGSNCDDNDTYSESVHLLFKAEGDSPWGRTGQLFDWENSGGRFRVDGAHLKLETECRSAFAFKFSIYGVNCTEPEPEGNALF